MRWLTKIDLAYMSAHEGFGENQPGAYAYVRVHENTPMRGLAKLTYTHERTGENARMRGLTKTQSVTNKTKNNLQKYLTFAKEGLYICRSKHKHRKCRNGIISANQNKFSV